MSNRRENTPLEQWLRSHYRRAADELHLQPRQWSEIAARPVPVAVDDRPGRQRVLVAASAAALVAGAVVGAGASTLLHASDGDETGASADVPLAAPVDSGELGAPAATDLSVALCPDDEQREPPPDLDVVNPGLPDDVRTVGILLPDETPAGYCIIGHDTMSRPSTHVPRYRARVFASCPDDCASPSAALAVLRGPAIWVPHGVDSELVEGEGWSGQLHSPGDRTSLAQLNMVFADGVVTVVGWGLDDEAFVDVADRLANGERVDGLRLRGGLEVSPYLVGHLPLPHQHTVAYWAEGGGEYLAFGVTREQVSLGSLAWAWPDADYSDGPDGARILAFPAAPYLFGGPTMRSAVVVQYEDGLTVSWTHAAAEPMTPEQLAEIALSPAAADDPRWVEIAWQSGLYEAVG